MDSRRQTNGRIWMRQVDLGRFPVTHDCYIFGICLKLKSLFYSLYQYNVTSDCVCVCYYLTLKTSIDATNDVIKGNREAVIEMIITTSQPQHTLSSRQAFLIVGAVGSDWSTHVVKT